MVARVHQVRHGAAHGQDREAGVDALGLQEDQAHGEHQLQQPREEEDRAPLRARQRGPQLRPHLRVGGDDRRGQAPAQEKEEVAQAAVSPQQLGLQQPQPQRIRGKDSINRTATYKKGTLLLLFSLMSSLLCVQR